MPLQSAPLARTLASYLPNSRMISLRRLADLPAEVRGRPHEVDYRAFEGFATRRPVVIDVGANRGQAIKSFRSVLSDPVIHSIEPNPHLAHYLESRFGSPDVTVYATGVGSTAQMQSLFIPRYGRTLWDTRASLSRSEAERALGPADFWRFRPSRLGIETLDVSIRPLDTFDLAPAILKVDTEGTEDQVIAGAHDTIRRHLPVILVEGSAPGSRSWLAGLGYDGYRFELHPARFIVGEPGHLNTFFLTAEHRHLFVGIDVGAG